MRKIVTLMAAVLVFAAFAGCGSQMEEYTAPNGEFGMQANASWKEQSTGDDAILALYSKDETKGIVIYQYLKSEYVFDDVEEFKKNVERAYPVHDSVSADAPESVPGLTNVLASTGGAIVSGVTEDIYGVYGESDHAYYALFYRAKKISDKQIEQFREYCGTFVEHAVE